MQVFIPFREPIEVAKCLDSRRLNKQIIECSQIIDAILGTGKGWFNHPVVKMYVKHVPFLEDYTNCLMCYQSYLRNKSPEENFLGYAEFYSTCALRNLPEFITQDLCDQHKRRLYTKDPVYYNQFAALGSSEENWYYVDNKLVKYVKGKKL